MPVTTNITKASVVGSGNARRNGKLRAKDRYVDDPEEEERLLGGSYDGSDEGGEGPERPPSPVKVRYNYRFQN
jgi:phospholipid-translocating ATPase